MVNIVNGDKEFYRNSTIDELVAIEKKCWPFQLAANTRIFEQRLALFEKGLWRYYDDNTLKAYVFFIRLEAGHANTAISWEDFTNNGNCTTHSDNGNILFGVSLTSAGNGYGKRLLDHTIACIRDGFYDGVKTIKACSRIPSLKNIGFKNKESLNFSDNLSIILKDPVVRRLSSVGFNPIKLVRDGYHNDSDSLGYSLLMELIL